LSKSLPICQLGQSKNIFSFYDGHPEDFELIAQWIIALNKGLVAGTLKDVELGGCNLELSINFRLSNAMLAVSQ